MEIPVLQKLRRPTLLLDENKARKNLKRMVKKAKDQSVRFRPHFKTHQSTEIGQWFRDMGVDCATVSSVSMANYFAGEGWKDITIAFPINLREMDAVCELAREINLGVLVESIYSTNILDSALNTKVNVWIKVDTGLHRTGLYWNDRNGILNLVRNIYKSKNLKLAGILTHAGQTYGAKTTEEIIALYSRSNVRMLDVRNYLDFKGYSGLDVSVGDTPGCWLCADLGEVDEIRPGNFIFFDAMMEDLGVCRREDIAVAVACPVVAKHEDRLEVIIYGGGIHLFKQAIHTLSEDVYGYISILETVGFRHLPKKNFVSALSQEHGIVKLTREEFNKICIGDIICVQPVHSCLAVDLLGDYLTLGGRIIHSMNSERIKNLRW